MSRKLKSTEERFWEKVDKECENGCWEWRSSLSGNGYGAFFTHYPEGRKCHRAHRFAWTLVNGKIPDGMWVLHKCDNRICVNPDHLFIGDRVDNMKDCAAKGRVTTIGQSKKTHCKYGHEFTPENTRRDHNGHRKCIECVKKSNIKQSEKRAAAIRGRGK